MSLLNNTDGNKNIGTVIIHQVARNTRTESFGDSVFNDAAAALGPATAITKAVYRSKALKAIEKRNRICGNVSEYVEMLANYSAGDSITAGGKTAEALLFEYIAKFCDMEIMVHKRNELLGNVNPVIEEKLANPPHPAYGTIKRNMYVNSIIFECQKDLAKVGVSAAKDGIDKIGAWLKEKNEQ